MRRNVFIRCLISLVILAGCLFPVTTAQSFVSRNIVLGSSHAVLSFDVYLALLGAAEKYRIDPALIAAIIEVESGFDPAVRSPVGAIGLMQLMPATAREVGAWLPAHPVQNVRGGIRYFRQLLNQFGGSRLLALAAYNAGPGNVARYGRIPPFRETRRYVPRVLRTYRKYIRLLRS